MKPEIFLNVHVAAYLLTIIGVQIFMGVYYHLRHQKIARRRSEAGLPQDILADQTGHLAHLRKEAAFQSGVFLLTLLLAPLLLVLVDDPDARKGLAVTFITLFFWLMYTGTDVVKAFLGGMAFKTLLAFKDPIQVGDRITIGENSGKVISIGMFFVVLQTPDDDQVSIPTATLWSQVLSSDNSGEQSSLCVMNFYLAPLVNRAQIREAEQMLREAIQASPYLEASKAIHIYFSQTPEYITLTPKAYVASTYNGPLFRSDVNRAFLEFALEKGIPLGSSAWRMQGSAAQ